MRSIGLCLLVVLLAFAAGYADFRDYDATRLTPAQRKEVGKKLTVEEGQKMTAWYARRALNRDALPMVITVAKAIQDQDEWVAKQAAQATTSAALKKEAESERAARHTAFANLLSVALVGKKNVTRAHGQKYVMLQLAFSNGSDRDIQDGCRGGVEARYRSGLAAPAAMIRLRGVDLAESYPRSVSPTPSSNWTCGFPASSSRTGFTCKHASRGGV